jgi:DNA phosphorothioation-associated putative methyltransferase
MMRLGVVSKERSVFDYGCGQGEDVEALSSQGFDAFGWDPHHAPEGKRSSADVVNLGFVLNVIEDPRERLETLRAAWEYARKALCVAVMVQGKVSTAGHKPFRDGFLTSRGTFQKYFDQQELREIVAATTGQLPLALAPGYETISRPTRTSRARQKPASRTCFSISRSPRCLARRNTRRYRGRSKRI